MTMLGIRTQDVYRTRQGGESGIAPRTDPVVWPGVDSGPASQAQLAAHERDGFHIVPELLDAGEVGTLRAELERLTTDPGLLGDQRSIREPGGQRLRSLFEVHRISAAIGELLVQSRLAGRARQILGSDVYVHQSRLNAMPGFVGSGFYWHSDFETWHAEDGMPRPRAVSVSVALTENYPYNGGLMLLPGAHRRYVRCAGETPEDHYRSSLVSQRVGVPSEDRISELVAEFGIDQFTGAAGSALWFDSNAMHASGNNVTPLPRSNLFIVFNSVQNALEAPYAASGLRPEFIASRDFRAVEVVN